MSPPPPTEGTAPLERLAHLRDTYGALPRAQRELVIFGLALLCGLIVMPFLIWYAGSRCGKQCKNGYSSQQWGVLGGEPRLLGRQEQDDDPGHHEPAGQGYGRPHEDSQQCRQRSHDVRAVLAKDEPHALP